MSSTPNLDYIAKNIALKTGKYAGLLEACQAVQDAISIGIPLSREFRAEYDVFMDNMGKLLAPKKDVA